MSEIVYPTGCRPLTEDLGTDELIRRLKSLTNILQALGQDDDVYSQYIPLAFHLADDYFLHHPSKDVQLLVACCIADLLRIYAPEAPYKEQHQVKSIFKFFIQQLYGLKDPKDPTFKRYFYLLENLAYVKTFNMCFDLEDCQEILSHLFETIFKIVNEHHSAKVKNFMIDILRPLVTEADNFTLELLDLILINILEPNKLNNKYAYQLAEALILKTSDSLEPLIKMFFNQVLVMDKIDKCLMISSKVYDLLYELNAINPDLLYSVLPQMECKLRATSEEERLRAVTLLARMFSEKDSQLIYKQPTLLKVFLGRFCDISTAVRVKCVQSSMHFLLHHPSLREEIISNLKTRQHDSDESVRYEVVMAIIETAKRDFSIIMAHLELLSFVKERMLDKKYRIRKEALSGLSWIYRAVICEGTELTDNEKASLDWVKNKVLHGYYMPAIEDRLLIERLLITSLVPYKFTPEERMKRLLRLLGSLDDHATKAFVELQKNQMKIRKTISDWVKLHTVPEITPKIQNQLNIKLGIICKLLPDPNKAKDQIMKFSSAMRKDQSIARVFDTMLKRDVTCKECADCMATLLKRFGTTPPVCFYQSVKLIIERIASVMVDREALIVLLDLIEKCLRRDKIIDEIGLKRYNAGEQGLKMLCTLSYVFSPHFFDERILKHMVSLLYYDEDYVAPLILKSLTHLGRYRSLRDEYPDILTDLAPICKDYALNGSVKEAKNAVRCIFVNAQVIRNSDPQAVILANANANIRTVAESAAAPQPPQPPSSSATAPATTPSSTSNTDTTNTTNATPTTDTTRDTSSPNRTSNENTAETSSNASTAPGNANAGNATILQVQIKTESDLPNVAGPYKAYLTNILPPDCTVPTSNNYPSNEVVPPSGVISIHPIFNEIIDNLRTTLVPHCDNQRTKVVTLGHIAFNMPQAFQVPIKNMIARRIVKELLIQPVPEHRDFDLPTGEWCEEDELPMDTLCKLEALKAMARWLIGLQTDELAAQKTFRMLNAFVTQRGDLLEQNRLCPAEKSWLRLGAACAMLKISEQKGVGDQYLLDHFYQLAEVMNDPVDEVRQRFVNKLHKGLGKCIPNKCLPLDFMGFYVLAGHETDKKYLEGVRHFIDSDILRRREYIKTITSNKNFEPSESQILHILPDFSLAFAIPILAHDPHFIDPEDPVELRRIEKCLRVLIDPLMAKRDQFSYSFYKNLIQMMKNHELKTSLLNEKNIVNIKMWTACDLAMSIINSKIMTLENPDQSVFDMKIKLPAMFYKLPLQDNFHNTKIYLPSDTFKYTPKNMSPTISTMLPTPNGLKRSNSASSMNSNRSGSPHDYSNENGLTDTKCLNLDNSSLMFPADVKRQIKIEDTRSERGSVGEEREEPNTKKPRILRLSK